MIAIETHVPTRNERSRTRSVSSRRATSRTGQHAAEHVDADGVQAGERLVEHEQLRVVHERGGELDALLVAQRQRLHAVARPLGEAEPLDPAAGGGRGGARVRAVQAREVDELVAHAHLRVQPALLRHVAEARPRGGVHPLSAPAHLAAVGREHPEHDPHRRRLAGAVGPDEAEQLAGRDGERDPVERDDVAVAAGEVGQLEHHARSTERRPGATTGTRTLSSHARAGRMRP
jgi:hypothetical protein